MGNVINMKRQAGDPSQEIQEGLEEYEEIRLSSFEQEELTADQVRARFNQKRRPWDRKWGGDCPYAVNANDKIVRGYKDLGAKPSLIDRLMPYILIIGFLGFCLLIGGLAEWVIDLTAGVR